jgi:hypothetical protein
MGKSRYDSRPPPACKVTRPPKTSRDRLSGSFELHPGLPVPAVGCPLQEVVEEALLKIEAVGAGEERPVRVAVHLEPLGGAGRRLREAVEVAARMDAMAAPVGAGEKRRPPEREIGRARAVPGVIQWMLLELLEGIHAIPGELPLGQRDGPSHRLTGVRVLLGVGAAAVLDVDDLVLGPPLLELAQDAAVVARVAVAIVLRDPGTSLMAWPRS